MSTLDNHYKGKLKHDFLKDRVAYFFPNENFYFFQLKDNDEDQAKEWPQLEAFLKDNIASKRYFI